MTAPFSLVRQRVSEAISLWRRGQRPDARQFIEQHPEVRAAQSLVVDLAYEEFCLRQEAGEQLDTERFLANFPTVQHSLARMLDVHGVMGSQGAKIDLETDWPEAGTRWLDWDLIEPLGRGAFSRVFLAREPALGNREVVLKCSFAGPHEAFILGSLSHPNIVPIHSTRHDPTRGLTAISMPLLGRDTLADALNRLAANGNAARTPALFGQSAEKDYTGAVLSLIQRVSSGLAAAHAAGVIHGDIKPSNVLLSFSGEPMLMDFNLSAGPGGDFERVGGTPPYMAPECLADFWRQPSRVAADLDPRSDVFSLGVVLLELLLGRIPFQFDLSRPETFPSEADWQGLARRTTEISREPKLGRVLNRCLAFDARQRYADADQLASEITAILSAKQQRRLWTRRLAMGAAASVVAGTGASAWIATYEDPNSLPALLRRAKEHISRQEFQEAVMLLMRVQKGHKDPVLMAWIGYCLAKIAHHQTACSYLEAAIKNSDRLDLRNNLGYCSAKLGKVSYAKNQFDLALQFNSAMQAVFHNRGNLLLDNATSNTLDLPESSWDDFKTAANLGPKNGELCVDSAKAIAYAHYRRQLIDGDLHKQIVLALAAGISEEVFRGTRFAHEGLNFDELKSRAKDLQGSPIPRSVPLILPPPIPLPEC
jgi:serine/threonine protein kinase